jgi:hypothetical protein
MITLPISYVVAIQQGFPNCIIEDDGDEFTYDDLVWLSGDAIPSKDDLDLWITNNSLSQFQFRQLFTQAERIAIDNSSSSTAIPAQAKAVLVTVMKDLESAAAIQLSNPQVAAGLGFMASLGLISSARIPQILSNTVPV